MGLAALWPLLAEAGDLLALRGHPELAAAEGADLEPRPVQGAPPRRWEDLGQGPLPSRSGTGASLRAAYASGRLTPTLALERLIARLDRGELGAVRHSPFGALDLATAREAASASAARWRAGAPLGPLDGVPVPVKDEHDMVGLPTTGGTRYRREPAGADSFAVRRLRAAGAVLPGKTRTTEWGMNPLGMNPSQEMPRNPWSGDRAAGGSSTGSGVAVALGLSPAAVGSDGGGSIRIPAALTGIYGLKPTFGRCGRSGDLFGAGSMTTVGPLGASAADLVDLLEVLGEVEDPADPLTRYAPDRDLCAAAWRASLGRGVRGARVGVLRRAFEDADPGVASAALDALRALEGEGARPRDVNFPLGDVVRSIGVLNIGVEAMGALELDLAQHKHDLGDEIRLQLAMLAATPALEVQRAVRLRARLRRQVAALLADLDVLVLPTTLKTAPRYPGSLDGVSVLDEPANAAVCGPTFLANLTGLPAGTLPVGLVDGLPAGLQVIGDAWDEASVLAVLAQAERLGIADGLHPPGWAPLEG